jgi:hypothetical protein
MPLATDLLRDDHRRVKELFKEFEETDSATGKRRVAEQCFMELEIHSQIEEEIFYPSIRVQDREEMDETMNEADEEHHVVDLLIAEMKKMRPADPYFAAKFTVMAENVKHHIQEEESEIFTKAAEAGSASLEQLGARMEERKLELMTAYGRKQARRGGRTGAIGNGRKRGSRNGRTEDGTRTMKRSAPRSVSAARTAGRKTRAAARGAVRGTKRSAGRAGARSRKSSTGSGR